MIMMLLVAAAVVVVVGGVTWAVWAAVSPGRSGCPHPDESGNSSSSVVSSVAPPGSTPDTDYWTPERMKSAKPMPMPAPSTDTDCH